MQNEKQMTAISNNGNRVEIKSKFKSLFGFQLSDLTSWDNFVKLMNRPEDPSSLAVFRILFGNLFPTILLF